MHSFTPASEIRNMTRHYIYLFFIGLLFVAFAVVFLFFPRSSYSELERRELKKAPDFAVEKIADGSYMADVSAWFSDTEPFRDLLMTVSMTIKKHKGIDRPGGEESYTFHTTGDVGADMMPGEMTDEERDAAELLSQSADRDIQDGNIDAADGEESKMTKSGILVVGKGEKVRALMNFSGTEKMANPYIATVNEYAERMPGVKIYSMVVPIAMEFYCPEEVRRQSGVYKPQLPIIKHIYNSLSAKVHPVNVYTTLSEHTDEPIFLRTDHHWAPLGAYYAAREFARVAGVHQPNLDEFDPHTIHRFVGTMYGYSKDIAVKNAAEDFTYYTPKNQGYASTFTIFNVDDKFHITGEGKPHNSSFFKKFKDGSGNAYLTFMGSDFLIAKVKTGVANGRKLAILKDSYGNALPGYLFGSFEEVHVLDFRYFPHNIVDYCRENGITDFLFVNNIFNACSGGVAAKQRALLTRKNNAFEAASPKSETSEKQPKSDQKNTQDTRAEDAESTESSPSEPASIGENP